MEKRRSKRHARRLKVRFGEKGSIGFAYSGLTNDVSASGLFVVTSQRPKPGTRMHFEVTLPGELPLFLEGVVMRLNLVPPELRQMLKAGFGARFLQGSELMNELVPTMSTTRDEPFVISFADETAWRAAVERDFKRGGVFVWTTKPVTQHMVVTVTFDLPFLSRQLAFDARVVQINPGADGRTGVAMMFVDPPAVIASLTSTLSH